MDCCASRSAPSRPYRAEKIVGCSLTSAPDTDRRAAQRDEALLIVAEQVRRLTEHVGTVEPGKLADLIVVDGDPLADPELLSDPARIWLVLQAGVPVAGQALLNALP